MQIILGVCPILKLALRDYALSTIINIIFKIPIYHKIPLCRSIIRLIANKISYYHLYTHYCPISLKYLCCHLFTRTITQVDTCYRTTNYITQMILSSRASLVVTCWISV